MRAWWSRLWFEPAPAAGLGITRALVFGGLLWHYARADFEEYASVSPVLYGASWFRPPVAPAEWLLWAHRAWIVALLLSCAGLFTRGATLAAFVLGAYLLGIDSNFGRVRHNDLPVVVSLGVLALSRCGDAFSLDAFRRGTRAAPDGEYRWPVRAVQLALATAFFAAGVAKLRHGGLDWIVTDNLRLQIVERSYEVVPARPLDLLPARFPLLCKALAAATVAIEALYPVALFSRRARIVLVPASLLMVFAFAASFGPKFTTFLILSVAWVPWDRILGRRPPSVPA